MASEFRSNLDEALSRSSAPKGVVASDRRVILRAGIDSNEKLLQAALARRASARTLVVVAWLLPRWPGGSRRVAYFEAAKSLLSHSSPLVRAETAVAMGLFRVKGPSLALIPLLNDESDDVRARAIMSLGIHGDPRTLPLLLRILANRKERVDIRDNVADALSGFNAEKVEAALTSALSDPSPRVRASAAHSLEGLCLCERGSR